MTGRLTGRLAPGALLTALTVMLASLVMSWTAPLNALDRVPASAVEVFAASDVNLPRQRAAADDVQPLTRRRTLAPLATTQYHLPDLPALTAGMIVIAHAGGPATFYVNAIAVEKTTAATLPGPVRGGYQLVSPIPPELLNPASNRLDVLVGDDLWRLGIGELRFGSASDVSRAVEQQDQRLGLIRALGLAAAVVGLVSALFTLAVRQAWAALAGGLIVCACLLMTTAGSTGTLPDEVLAVAARLAGSALFVGGFLALWGTGSMPASASGPWQGLSAMTLLAGLVSIIGWRVGVPDLLAASLGDLAPVFLCGVGLPLAAVAATRQLVVERAEARSLAARQSATVADQAIRLQQQAELQAVAEERKRFARDIHDGIGGQLVSLLWRARYEPIPQAEMVAELEQGIADLRLVVDALDEGPVSLQVALSNFAHRARQQLDAAGVAFTWDIPLDFDLEWSDPRRILSFYRVLQESVSNVVRHARATSMSIRVTCPESREGGHLRVEIADNGIGFDPDRQVGGRGLANLRSRTSALGGTLHLQSAQGKGTTILIDLPSEAGPSRLESADPENSPTSVGST